MSLPVFAVDPGLLPHDVITLAGEEARHATVKRIRVGEWIMLTDGRGSGAECVVQSVAKASLVCEVRVRRETPPAIPHLTVVQAIPKGDHADRAVDLLTEVGVDRIVPWAAARCVAVWRGERVAKGRARWAAVATAAAKQSRRLRFPEVSPQQSTPEVAALVGQAALAVVLHESATESLASVIDGTTSTPRSLLASDVLMVVGPEGGLTDEELSVLGDAGARVAHVGSTVLRSSSAGVVAASVVLSRTASWQ